MQSLNRNQNAANLSQMGAELSKKFSDAERFTALNSAIQSPAFNHRRAMKTGCIRKPKSQTQNPKWHEVFSLISFIKMSHET